MKAPSDSLPAQWKASFGFLRSYSRAYGGIRNLWKSPYAQIALLFTLISFGIWNKEGWWDIVLNILPDILGFTLGAFALVVAMASDQFGAILSTARKADQDPIDTPLAKLGATFVHFLILQSFSIAAAIVAKGFYSMPAPNFLPQLALHEVRLVFWFFCALSTSYALVSVLATTEWIFQLLSTQIIYHKKIHQLNKSSVGKPEHSSESQPNHPALSQPDVKPSRPAPQKKGTRKSKRRG